MKATITIVITLVFMVNLVFAKRSKTSQGVPHPDCPMDDDPNDPTILPVEKDCTKFLKCSYGKAYTLSCPRGEHWSIELDRCDSPEIAMCEMTKTTPTFVVGGGSCTFSYKRHPTDCDKAIDCANGQESVITCLKDMYWNQELLKCDFDESVCQS